ncbi:MAG: hypothetical protein HOO91_07955 [Bacteroidales bacterium]|nr:hypothetical protein [Bacteroidales bacterium]
MMKYLSTKISLENRAEIPPLEKKQRFREILNQLGSLKINPKDNATLSDEFQEYKSAALDAGKEFLKKNKTVNGKNISEANLNNHKAAQIEIEMHLKFKELEQEDIKKELLKEELKQKKLENEGIELDNENKEIENERQKKENEIIEKIILWLDENDTIAIADKTKLLLMVLGK